MIQLGIGLQDVGISGGATVTQMQGHMNPLTGVKNESIGVKSVLNTPNISGEKGFFQNYQNLSIIEKNSMSTAFQNSGLIDKNFNLTNSAIQNAKNIPLKDRFIRNPIAVDQLTKDGSNISDWGKYKTPSTQTFQGSKEIHFYMKHDRSAVNQMIDYKVK